MPQTLTGTACASCSTNKSIDVPGLDYADLSSIHITQGTPWEARVCFIKSESAFQILATTAAGEITVNRDDHCLEVGDSVRLVNYDKCTNDTIDAETVFPVASITPDPVNSSRDIIALTGATLVDATYMAPTVITADFSFFGCAEGVSVEESQQSPYALEVCSGADMVVSGGVWTRDDLYSVHNVYAISGESKIYSSVLGKVKVGDMVIAPGLGIDQPTLVQRIDVEEGRDAAGKSTMREVYTINAVTTASSDCTPLTVKRGLAMRVDAVLDGDCFVVRIPEWESSKLQLSPDMRQGDYYNVGTLLVLGHYGRLVGGQMQMATVELMRSSVMLKPSHLF